MTRRILFGRNAQLSFADVELEGHYAAREKNPDYVVRMLGRISDEAVGRAFWIVRDAFAEDGAAKLSDTEIHRMLRVHLVQIALNLSDPGMEALLMADLYVRRFCGFTASCKVPSDTTILRFRRRMENNDLGRALFMDSVKAAEEDGAIPEEDYAVAVDATFIDAPSSTKNKDRARDPEMASGRKAQTWHFGMKLHVAAAVGAGIIRACVAGPANEHDITRLGDVLTGKETKGVFVDSGYTGCFKREDVAQFNLDPQKWFIAAKPSTVRKYEKLVENQEGTLAEKAQAYLDLYRSIEFSKASVRCCVEWSFLWLKRIFGYAKTRYRGIAKNHKRCLTLYGLYNWIRLNSWREAQAAQAA